MIFRILMVESLKHGTVTNVEATKPELMEYMNELIRQDQQHSGDDTYPNITNSKQVSLLPVLQSPEAWDYMKRQITMSPDINKIYADKILSLFNNQTDAIYNISQEGYVKICIMMFVFPVNEGHFIDKRILSTMVMDGVEETLDEFDDKHNIDEISFGVIEEMEEMPADYKLN